MTLKVIEAIVGWLFVGLISLQATRVWRDPLGLLQGSTKRPPNATRGRTVARIIPLADAFLITAVLSLTLDAAGETHAVATEVVAMLALIVLMLVCGVLLYNRPRWVVPPALREDPGAFGKGR
jgi:hypothetical protein